MSDVGGRPIRGYRPSRYGCPDEEDELTELARLANVEAYAKRASAGLPIFQDVQGKQDLTAKPTSDAG